MTSLQDLIGKTIVKIEEAEDRGLFYGWLEFTTYYTSDNRQFHKWVHMGDEGVIKQGFACGVPHSVEFYKHIKTYQ